MQKYISVNELYSKLCGRLSTLQLEKIKSIIAECDTITVNESTGLRDKNGKLIFEGDVVFVCDDNGFADLSDTGKGNVIFYESMWYIDGEIQNLLYDICRNYYVEVIGNVHNNPELLEGER